MNKHRDYRYQLAAINFLSNISLDGTYQDTNFAYLFENKLKSVEKLEEPLELVSTRPEPALADSVITGSSDEEAETVTAVGTPDENVFLGKRMLILSGLRHSVLSVLSALPFPSQKSESHHAEGTTHRNRRVSSGSLTLREAIFKIGNVTQFHEDMSVSQYLHPVLLSSSPAACKSSRPVSYHAHRNAVPVATVDSTSSSTRVVCCSASSVRLDASFNQRSTMGGEGPSALHNHPTSFSSDNIIEAAAGVDAHGGSLQLTSAEHFKNSMPLIHKEFKTVSGIPSPILQHQQPPLLLDDPEMTGGRHKTVLKLPFYSTTILEYVRSSDLKRDLNLQFRERYPHIQISLTKIRSIKADILHIAKRLGIDLWIVGQTYVLFERLIYKGVVNKTNRKVCCGMVFLLTAKINDVKGAELNGLREELESYVKVTAREMVLYELATLLALEFSLLVLDADILAHLQRILPTAGPRKHSTSK